MDLYVVNVKKYKSVFYQVLIVNIICTITSYLLVVNGMYLLHGFDPGAKLTLPILSVMVVLSVWHSKYQRKQLLALIIIDEFDARVQEYEKLYTFRMLWYLFSCLVSCFLAVLTGRTLFTYYAAFDILVSISYYPKLALFKRELQNDEIMFY